MYDILVGKTEKEQEREMRFRAGMSCDRVHGDRVHGGPQSSLCLASLTEALYTAGTLRDSMFLLPFLLM